MQEDWFPGSFTKNFSWGPQERGLKELYEVIKIGFDGKPEDVPRKLFKERVSSSGRPDYIPLNFFLFNKVKFSVDHVIADELVFQAVNFRHSANFDKLALFAFNLSMVGLWRAAKVWQSRPALWAYHYVADRVGSGFDWNTKQISADDIERFVSSDPRYQAQTSRKLSTNLNYLYRQGRLSEFRSNKPERWWLSALFLSLDRSTETLLAKGELPRSDKYEEYLIKSGFHYISGKRSVEKDLAALHFVELYDACGGRARFSEDAVRERQRILLPEINQFANDPDPIGVFHPTDPSARNAIPRACAVLASYLAGFETIGLDELDNFDISSYVRDKTRSAIISLKNKGVRPTMSAEELLSLTRGE